MDFSIKENFTVLKVSSSKTIMRILKSEWDRVTVSGRAKQREVQHRKRSWIQLFALPGQHKHLVLQDLQPCSSGSHSPSPIWSKVADSSAPPPYHQPRHGTNAATWALLLSGTFQRKAVVIHNRKYLLRLVQQEYLCLGFLYDSSVGPTSIFHRGSAL